MLGDCFMWRCQEWVTMVADVDHLGHVLLTDVTGLSWVVFYVEIHEVMYQTLVIPPQQGEEGHPCWHQSHWLGSLRTELVVMLLFLSRYIMVE